MSGEKRIKRGKFFLVGAAVLFILLISLYYIILHPEYFNPKEFIDKMFLYFLSLVIIILILGVLFILFRNFVKIIVERRRGILGSKFRTKLIFIFFIPLLVPSIALFYAAMTIIQKSVENLLTPQVNDITSYSKEIVDYFNEELQNRCLYFAEGLSGEITGGQFLDMDRRESLVQLLDVKLKECKLDLIVIYLSESEQFFVHDPAMLNEGGIDDKDVTAFPAHFLDSALKGEKLERIDYLSHGYVARSVVPILSSFNNTDVVGALLAGIYVREDLAAKAMKIDESRKEYLQMKAQKRDIKRIYIYIIALIALLILFSATWVGMYLTRQITVPIQKLAEGTREISAGNLDYRVEVNAGDELGMLVDSFNTMTSELKTSKSILEERKKYIETLLDNITAGVISINKEGEVTAINKAAMRILNIRPEVPTVGAHFEMVIKEEEISPLKESIRDMLGNEYLHISQEFIFTMRGRSLNIAANFLSLKDIQENYLGILVFLEDLTQVIRAQKMEAWREVAKRIAHEIKNPLTPIQLSAQRIMKKYSEGGVDLKDIITDGTSTIINQVNTLKGMVDEFSQFARMPSIRLVPSDLHAVIDSAVSLYAAAHPVIRFDRMYEKDAMTVTIDPEQMKRVMINLIDNSIEAMKGRGVIAIATKLIVGTKRVRIEFADDGPGISSEDKERLFIPYFSTKKVGTGLGLAIVQRIIADHNGFITVEDNVPRGARFIIELPL